MRELIYRDDCDLNAPSMDRDGMIRDLMNEYSLNWEECDEEKVFEFARELIEKAQNVINTANTVAYEKEKYKPGTGDTVLTYIRYLTYEENDE